tara:strand:- start:778 stop:1014 length:237 start_codon:yes stop_codon:yes gene_type:complete
MAKPLTNYLNNITKLDEKITLETENDFLRLIDLDELDANPVLYLTLFLKEYFESLDDEIQIAIDAGTKKANEIIKEIR